MTLYIYKKNVFIDMFYSLLCVFGRFFAFSFFVNRPLSLIVRVISEGNCVTFRNLVSAN